MTAERHHRKREGSDLTKPRKDDDPWTARKRKKMPMAAKNAWAQVPDISIVDDSEMQHTIRNSTDAQNDFYAPDHGFGTEVTFYCGCIVKYDTHGTEYILNYCPDHPDGPPAEYYEPPDERVSDNNHRGKSSKARQSVENTIMYNGTYDPQRVCGDCGADLWGSVEGAWKKGPGAFDVKFKEWCPTHGLINGYTQRVKATRVEII